MTREEESDSTQSHEKEEGGIGTPSPQRLEGRRGYQHPLLDGYVPQPRIASKGVMCSFCGVNTPDYRDCPVMHQYIREQADALPKGGWKNTNTYRNGRDMKFQGKHHLIRGLSLEGGQVKEGQYLVRGPLTRKPRSRKHQLSD